MKKLNHIFTLLVVALVGLSLTACSEDDNLNTNQYGGDITLTSFGPCPVLRGGTLHFLGKNLDQIVEVDLPGADPITAIDVITAGAHSEITIKVPAEKCEPGTIILKTAKGGIIETVTTITYREDIKLTDFFVGTEGNKTANVGDAVTFTGDYLNLIEGVIFADKDTVYAEDFIEHTRYKIVAPINKFAKTGTIILSNLWDTPTEIETDEAITINLPAVPTIANATPKAGSTVTLTGTDLDQIEKISLPGSGFLTEFTEQTATTLSFVIPATAQDGNIKLYTFSGVEISGPAYTTVAPSGLAVNPTPAKNRQKLNITGTDLDLVSSVSFPNAGAYTKTSYVHISADQVVVDSVPENAQEGDITLTMENGKEVTVAYTLVKPTVTSADPASITAGEEVVIYGTDLDLVSAVVFPGDAPQTVEAKDFAAQEEEGIQLTIPAAAYGTGMELVLKNGADNIVISGILTIIAASDPAISEAPAGALAGDEVTIKGKNFNNVQNIYIGEYKVTRYTSKSNTEITFKVPADAPAGDYYIIMENHDGNKFTGPAFSVLPAETTIWEGTLGPPNWSGDKMIPFTDTMKAQLIVGKTLGIEFTVNGGWGQMEICGAWWTQLQGPKDAWVAMGNSLNGEGRAIMDFNTSGVFEFTILQGDIDILNTQGSMLFVGGGELYVNRLYVK